MYKQFFCLILSLGLVGSACANAIVQDNFAEDPNNPMQMSAHHAGNSMQALCAPASVGDDPDDPCPIVIKNNIGRTLTVQGLNADEVNTAEVIWYTREMAVLDFTPANALLTYSLVINFNTLKTYSFLNFIALNPKGNIIAVQNKIIPTGLTIANLDNQAMGITFSKPLNAVKPKEAVYADANSLYQTADFDARGNLVLTYLTSNYPLKTKSVVIPINPAQFVPINPSDIGTFDLKTLNADSGNSST